MLNVFEGTVGRGGCTNSKAQKTHKRSASPQHTTDHGDRGTRVSSGRCPANGPGGCRIYENYYCSAFVRARANLWPGLETPSGEEMPRPDLCLRSGRNTLLSVDFRIMEIAITKLRLHMQCVPTSNVERILLISEPMTYIGVP